MTPPVDTLRAAMADLLALAGEVLRDPRYRHAAGVLRGQRAGRPPLPDVEALALAEALLASGAKSRRAACQVVASIYAPPGGIDAMRDRLQRKLRRK